MSKNNLGEGLQNFINFSGAIAEMTRVMYDRYIAVGFKPAQASDFTKHMVATQLQIAALMPKKEDGDE